MTDRITPERREELREWVKWRKRHAEEDLLPTDTKALADLLALLDPPAPPTSEERQKLLTRLDVMNNHYKDTMFHGDWPVLGVKVHNAEVGAIRSLILSAPKTVTRPDWFKGIVCFCGSSRFIDTFGIFMWEWEKAGWIALGLHWLPPTYKAESDHQAEAEGVADKMDALHKIKIDMADLVFIINQDGYVGDSTKSEIRYAVEHGKRLRWLEPESKDAILSGLGVRVEDKSEGDKT